MNKKIEIKPPQWWIDKAHEEAAKALEYKITPNELYKITGKK
jgi:hypothetical protein